MTDNSPIDRDHVPVEVPPHDEAAAAPATSPIPLDEEEIRERAEQDDDETDSLV